jgi:putative addiction module component (TIGR02574 family)
MNTRAKELLEDALGLPDVDRAELAAELIASLDPGIEQDAAEAWDAEIARRVAELDAGKAAVLPWSEARRMISGQSDEPSAR